MAAMAAVSFAESSFFPMPPDILLVPMTLAQPRRAWLIATVCTVASVLGGYVGYAIGYYLFDAVGRPGARILSRDGQVRGVEGDLRRMGCVDHHLEGLTPIPFKLVTIASGAAQFDLLSFTVASLVSRSLRFFPLAALLWRFGEPIRDFIEHRLMLVTTMFAAALVGGLRGAALSVRS